MIEIDHIVILYDELGRVLRESLTEKAWKEIALMTEVRMLIETGDDKVVMGMGFVTWQNVIMSSTEIRIEMSGPVGSAAGAGTLFEGEFELKALTDDPIEVEALFKSVV